jgi:glucose/arabinose dehydrogenase
MKCACKSGQFGKFCVSLAIAGALLGGCAKGPSLVPLNQRQAIDRTLVEYPTGYQLVPVVRNLTAPTAMAFDQDGSLIIADEGMSDRPRILAYKPDGSSFDIYPRKLTLPFGIAGDTLDIRGPVGGMVAANGKAYVAHRNNAGRGVITAFEIATGKPQTVVADLPAEGDHGMLDLVLNRYDNRLYFAIGSMTNSGVVGLDNWAQGWVVDHELAADASAVPLKLLGYRFDTPNPKSGLFGGSDIAVTAPFQPFGRSNQTWVRPPANGKPTAAIYSISPAGGDLRIEAHGIRSARGLAFNDFGRLYATNQGMELRGTRPVKDDPDSLIRIIRNTWYGWPDFSADLQPITEPRFQPPAEMIIKTGYPELSFLLDHQTSGLLRPDRSTLLQATFSPLSGAAKMDFAPSSGPFRGYYGSVVVALSGDRAPFATGGQKLIGPVGYRIVQVDVDNHQTHEFIHNTRGLPSSLAGKNADALERPFDVKFGPDGALYILDLGRVEVKDARLVPVSKTGKLLKLTAP